MDAVGVRPESISIHAPLTGSDVVGAVNGVTDSQFQSTLPSQGATNSTSIIHKDNRFQSTLPSQGATT